MTKVLIFGANGALGGDLVPLFRNQFRVKSYDTTIKSGVDFVDITDFKSLETLFAAESPECIINLAAITDLEFCEKNPELAQRVNADGAGNLAALSKQFGCKMVHISTGGVFNGKVGGYTEDDSPDPINVYSKSKLDGEHLVMAQSSSHLILRAGWLSSGGRNDKKFIGKITEKLLNGDREIAAVNDTIGSPTFSFDFINQCLTLLRSDAVGIYHVCNEGFGTRHDIAKEIVKIMNLDVHVQIADANQFKHLYFAQRPINETMICKRLKDEGLFQMPHWTAGLKSYVNRILTNE